MFNVHNMNNFLCNLHEKSMFQTDLCHQIVHLSLNFYLFMGKVNCSD